MRLEGGCYCRALRYVCEGKPVAKAQCHCRECQYFSGGGPNYFLMLPAEGFSFVKGTPQTFTRSDLDNAVTREFCATCGTHLTTRRPDMPEIILKAGTLDQPELFEHARMAIFTVDRQPFHHIPDGIPSFSHLPKR